MQVAPNESSFIGRHYHALGAKGRVSLPKPFRPHFDTAKGIITIGLDGSLFLFTYSRWQHLLDSLQSAIFSSKKHRDWIRLLTNNATSVKPDSLGRILIPEYLRQEASLKKDVVIVGSLDRIEIWDRTTYHSYDADLHKRKDQIAESFATHT